MPAVGGKIGPIRTIDPPPALPRGFSRVYARAMTLFVASDAACFADLKVFLRDGKVQKPVVMRIYRVAGCKTEIEIPDQAADTSASMARRRSRCCANYPIRVAFGACI